MQYTTAGYDIREPIEVRIMADRIHILSFPGPDKSVSDNSIKESTLISRTYRNRRIGEFLKELKLTEGKNTGIPKIKRALKNNESPEPTFETDEERRYFITTILIHENFKNEKNGTVNGAVNGTVKLTKNEIKILNLIAEKNTITREEISQKAKISLRTISRNINSLKDKSKLQRVGSDKTGYWEIL